MQPIQQIGIGSYVEGKGYKEDRPGGMMMPTVGYNTAPQQTMFSTTQLSMPAAQSIAIEKPQSYTTYAGGAQLGSVAMPTTGYAAPGTSYIQQTYTPAARTIDDIGKFETQKRPSYGNAAGASVIVQQQQQQVVQRPSDGLSGSRRGKRHSAAEEATETVHSMHIQMSDVEETINIMQAENEWLKSKLLQDRQTTLTKYFMRDAHLTMQAVVHEWKRIMEVLRRMREVDGVESVRAADRARYVHRIAELEEQIAYSNELYRRSELEKTEYQERLALAEKVIYQARGDVEQFPLSTEPQPAPTVREKAKYMKTQLHKMLGETDPAYLPANILNDAEGMGDLDSIMRQQFAEADRDRDGQLQWNNGEIRHFIRRSLEIANHKHPEWNDWEWYTMYRQFDKDGSHTMSFEECSALAKAVRDAAHGGPPVPHATNIQATVVPASQVASLPQTQVW